MNITKSLMDKNVETLLYWYYRGMPEEIASMSGFEEYCLNYSIGNINTNRMLMRFKMAELNQNMVRAVVIELPETHQRFLYYFYAKDMMYDKISLEIGITKSNITAWHRAIRDKVSDFLNFKLTLDDVFIRRKIINMLEILAQLINMADKLDDERHFIDDTWYQVINNRYNNYRKLLNELEDCIEQHELGSSNHIIYNKYLNPNISLQEIAKKCHYSTSQVSRYLTQYKESVKKYLSP